MKLTIVTPSFNQARYLDATIRSVLEQGYRDLEYILIDGASTDGSVEIIRRSEQDLSYWITEPDRGQVDAINKGLVRATGEIVAYLNSDDVYLPGAFEAVGRYFQSHPNCQWLCGDTIRFGEDHDTVLIQANVPRSASDCFSWRYWAPQPGMFWRRELLEGGFDERWRYCFDHELYIRLLLEGHKCDHLPIPVAAYRLHPTSKTVAEGAEFETEFDAIAEYYETRVKGATRRWCRGTRLLRQAYTAGKKGQKGSAIRQLVRGLLANPASIATRPFWGSLRSIVSP